MEYMAYFLLALVAAGWLIVVFMGVIVAFPLGIIGLIAIIGIGLLFAKALSDRVNNREDDHYDKTVDK